MAIVTFSTIFQTIFVSLILLLSKGWGYARNSLSREDLSTITVSMGAVYLIYSAYFVASAIQGLSNTIQLLMNSLYVVLLVVVLKNTCETRQLL
jgi:TRAP-type C4-dicarboxylate transport system permease small subunit